MRSVSVLVFMVGELKAGGINGCLFGTVRWLASSSQAKSRAIRFLAVGDRLRAGPVGAAVDELEAGEIEGDSLGTAVGGLEAGGINRDTVGMAVGELKAGEMRAARSTQTRSRAIRSGKYRARGGSGRWGLAQHEVGGREKKLRSLRARARRDSWKEERKNDGLGTSIVCVCADAASECDSSFDICST